MRAFAQRLRNTGLTVILDQFAQAEEFNDGGPPDAGGWSSWSYDQIEKADKVLIIGSTDYYLVYERKEMPAVGIGCAIEAQRIFTQLYDKKGHNEKFRVVILANADDVGIPDHLSGYHRFHPDRSDADFDHVVVWLKGSAPIAAPAPPAAIVWPAPDASYAPDLANRSAEFAFFTALLAGTVTQRAVFFEAPGNRGKTTLVAECMRYAHAVLGAASCVTVDFKAGAAKEQALETLRLDAGLPHFSQPGSSPGTLRADLRSLTRPMVLLFDTYEKASPDARELVEGLLLGDLEKCPAVRIAIAGQTVPDHAKALWAKSVRHFALPPITDPQHWQQLAATHYPRLTAEHIMALTVAAAGNPGVIRAGLLAVHNSLPLET